MGPSDITQKTTINIIQFFWIIYLIRIKAFQKSTILQCQLSLTTDFSAILKLLAHMFWPTLLISLTIIDSFFLSNLSQLRILSFTLISCKFEFSWFLQWKPLDSTSSQFLAQQPAYFPWSSFIFREQNKFSQEHSFFLLGNDFLTNTHLRQQ